MVYVLHTANERVNVGLRDQLCYLKCETGLIKDEAQLRKELVVTVQE